MSPIQYSSAWQHYVADTVRFCLNTLCCRYSSFCLKTFMSSIQYSHWLWTHYVANTVLPWTMNTLCRRYSTPNGHEHIMSPTKHVFAWKPKSPIQLVRFCLKTLFCRLIVPLILTEHVFLKKISLECQHNWKALFYAYTGWPVIQGRLFLVL